MYIFYVYYVKKSRLRFQTNNHANNVVNGHVHTRAYIHVHIFTCTFLVWFFWSKTKSGQKLTYYSNLDFWVLLFLYWYRYHSLFAPDHITSPTPKPSKLGSSSSGGRRRGKGVVVVEVAVVWVVVVGSSTDFYCPDHSHLILSERT